MLEQRLAICPTCGQPLLPHRQFQIVEFVIAYLNMHSGLSPSLREIQEGTGMTSVPNVVNQVAALVKKGFLLKERGKCRTIRPTNKARTLFSVPSEKPCSIGPTPSTAPMPATT